MTTCSARSKALFRKRKMTNKRNNKNSLSKKSTNSIRKSERFSKNSNFIQRSREMEKLYRKASHFPSVVDGDKLKQTVNLLPSLKSVQNESYEQLLTQYGTANKVPSHSEDWNQCLLSLNKDHVDTEIKDTADLKPFNSFSKRFSFELTPDDISELMSPNTKILKYKWSGIENFKVEIPLLKSLICADSHYLLPPIFNFSNPKDLQKLEIKLPLSTNSPSPLSTLQMEIFHIANNYLDLYCPMRSHNNAEEIRYTYCLHAVNHMLKVRALILRNNAKIVGLAKSPKTLPSEMPILESFRDQGFTRLKVLILLPFRESALKSVQVIANLLFPNHRDTGLPIVKYEHFVKEFSGNTIHFPKTNPKPTDYEQTFTGNTDDNFKVGIRFTKKSVSLFSDISASDILIASPLALRMIINDKDKEFDFLNSIEVLIIDQGELFIAQNWENLVIVLDHLHLKPQKLPETNCQRIRTYCLNGTSRFYRQTLFFASHDLPEFRGLINNKCYNFQGKLSITNKIEHGDISNVLTSVEQIFQRIDCSNIETAFENRFQYFVRYIQKQLTRSSYSHCMIYVPSYFDYVRLRNYFKNEMLNFVQISEYTKKEKISRARDIFFHGGAPILLYSERSHFFRRTRIKGVRHLIIYQPPNFPNFYSEIINLMLEANQNPRDGLKDIMSVKVLYTKYDILTLSNIVGNDNAVKLATGESDSYSFSNKM